MMKIEGRRLSQLSENFDNKPSIWPAAPILIFSNWQTTPNVTAPAVGQRQRLYSGVRIYTGNYLSSPLQIPRG
jgi:hypothetical protein